MVASKCVVASSSTRARHSSKSALTEEHFMGSASRAVKSRSVLTTGRSMVLDQRRDRQEVPAEELGDGAADGVVVVAAFGAAMTAVSAILADLIVVALDPRVRVS